MGPFIRELGILVSYMSFMPLFKQKIMTKLDKKKYGLSEQSLRAAVFPIKMWNHFDNDDDRINNTVEGDNNKMRIFCGAAQPDISKAVRLLRIYETTAHDKYKNAQKKSAHIKKPFCYAISFILTNVKTKN